MSTQQNGMTNPTVDATVDAQLATATGRDAADSIIGSFVSGSISLADFCSQLVSSFPSNFSEGIHLLNHMVTDTRIPFEVFQRVIAIVSTPASVPEHAAAILMIAYRNGNLELGKWIIETFPTCVEFQYQSGQILFYILFDESIDDGFALTVLELLLERHPNVVRNARTSKGHSLLHWAAVATTITMRAVAICRSIIHACPQLVLEHDDVGYLPLHRGCMSGNSEFVICILEKCPDAMNLMSRDDGGYLPLHCALVHGQLDVMKRMLKKYPDAIKGMTRDGFSPLHVTTVQLQSIPQEALNMIRYLLEVDPSVASVRSSLGACYPLNYACLNTNASNLRIGLQAIASIYNAYPQALVNHEERFRRLIDSDDCEDGVKNFLAAQLRYAEQASNYEILRTPDENGRLPLHNALRDCAPLGSIQLLADANPSALQRRDSSSLLPLHIACEYHDCPDVTMYLLDYDSRSLFDQDNEEGNTPLHCACRAGNYALISMIFAQHQNLPVKERNSDDDLPIHLLVDNRDQDDDSTGYFSCLFLFLKADPDLLLSVDEI